MSHVQLDQAHALYRPHAGPITLDTLDDLFASRRAVFGGYCMEDPPEPQRPEGISEEEWTALGDPGKKAIVRERERNAQLERDLAVARAKPAPPRTPAPTATTPPTGVTPPATAPSPDGQPDVAKLIADGIAAAMKPFEDREQHRQNQAAAELVRDAVLKAAESRFHDATDALGNVDLTAVVNEQGAADAAKITAALDAALSAKPHLAKATHRVAPPGIGGGGPAVVPEAEQVKSLLAQMQSSAGVRTPPAQS